LIKADLHIHTTYSDDSTVTPKILVEQLVSQSSIKVAALTDHNTIQGCKLTRQMASAYPDILVIPGVEISTAEGDIVILGTEELPPEPWTVGGIVDFARQNGSVSVVAHPYREYGMGDTARKYKFDAIEVLNGASSASANKSAQELARLMNLPGVAGTDAHQQEDLGKVYTEIQSGLDIEEILKSIKKGLVKAYPAKGSIHF
jgi:predicted metal-dependent phosphoesterase TrpH